MFWLNLLLVVIVAVLFITATSWGIYKTYKLHRTYRENKGDRP